jgi:predicted O-methyltransferase YrrM
MNAGFDDLPPLLREMLATGRYHDPKGVEQTLHSNITAEEAVALHQLVRSLRPMASAEIGFALGVSGLAILSALEANGGEGRHHACDPGQTGLVAGGGLEHVRRAGLSHRLEFFEKFPEEIFSTFPRLQFAFIDASHLFDLSILDFILVDKRLDVGGVVGFHDLWMPSLQKVTRYILANRAYRIHAASPRAQSWTPRQKVKSTLGTVLRSLPWSQRLFTSEATHPWHEFSPGNMIFLEKLADDTRDWRHHVSF